jgi:hypothetical protein
MTGKIPDIGVNMNEEDALRVSGVRFDRVWNGVAAGLWSTEANGLERTASRLLRSPALARALIATPSLFVAWLLASIVIFTVGAFMTVSVDQPIVPLLAPAIAGVGVSLAYGPAADPAWDITRTMAVPERMLLLRVVAVFITNTMIGFAATVVTDRTADVTFSWLLPMTSIALVGLAVAVASNSGTIGGVSALVVWFGFTMATFVDTRHMSDVISSDRIAASSPIYLVLMLASVGVVWISTTDSWKRGFLR